MSWKDAALLIGIAFVLLSIAIIPPFITRGPNAITLNITGVVNATNSSVASLHLQCIEDACNKHYFNDYSKLKLCYEQCEKIGALK